jgi:glucose/arabinose dehydrogenase
MNDEGLLVNEQVLLDNIPAPGGNHNGGDLQFGNDGFLYITVGLRFQLEWPTSRRATRDACDWDRSELGAIHLAFGPDNALYSTTFEGGGQVRRIVQQ